MMPREPRGRVQVALGLRVYELTPLLNVGALLLHGAVP
jgi:hypothetical protein